MLLNSRRPRGMTLVEVLVTGVLFSVILGMIAQAMAMGYQSQRNLSQKVDTYRKASTALDLLIRDVEVAQNTSFLRYFGGGSTGAVPAGPVPTEVNHPDEFQITRTEGGVTIYDPPSQIMVGYRRLATDSTLRRTLYDPTVPTFLPGTPPTGRIVAKDVNSFDIRLDADPSSSLSILTVRIQVGTIAEPLTKQIWVEGPTP